MIKLRFSVYILTLAIITLFAISCGGSEASVQTEAAPSAEQAEPIATGDFEGGDAAIGDESTSDEEADETDN